ncbi:MAG: DUF2007 domain-containing protein [Aestuariivita sp.]|nr:DUF2007 domain-containing protein [Aestuariivita sp.]
MKELLRSNDPTVIAFATVLLNGENIECFEVDSNMSILEGSLGIIPRRILVPADDYDRAVRIMKDNQIDLE